MHIGDEQRTPLCRAGTTDTAPHRYANAGRPPLEGPQDKFLSAQQIKAHPVQIREYLVEECAEIGEVGDQIGLTSEQSPELLAGFDER